MVNTQTGISKKVLAVILAVACMVCFTPSIAFTQSAHADTALSGSIELASGASTLSQQQVATYFGVALSNVTVESATKTYTVKLSDNITYTLTSNVIQLDDGVTLNLDLNGKNFTASQAASIFTLINGAKLNITNSGTTQGKVTAKTAVANIAGTSGNVTIDKNVVASAATGITTASKAVTGTITVNGYVTGTTAAISDASAMTVTGSGQVAKVSAIGDTPENPDTHAVTPATKASTSTTLSVKSVDGTLAVGSALDAESHTETANSAEGFTYTWYRTAAEYKTAADVIANGTKIQTGTDKDHAWRYFITSADQGSWLYCIKTDGTTVGYNMANGINLAKATIPVVKALTDLSNDGGFEVDTPYSSAHADIAIVGQNLSDTIVADATSGATCKWYMNTSKSTAGATEITNATRFGNGYFTVKDYLLKFSGAPMASDVGTHYIYCVATNAAGVSEVTQYYTLQVENAGLYAVVQPQDFTVAIGDSNHGVTATSESALAEIFKSQGGYSDNQIANTYFEVGGDAYKALNKEADTVYQWYFNTVNSTINATKIEDLGNKYNTITKTIAPGITADLHVDGINSTLANSNACTLSVQADKTAKAGTYYFFCTAKNGTQSITSNVIAVTVAAPAITAQPKSKTYLLNEDAAAMKVGTNFRTKSYQWYTSTTPVTGATAASVAAAVKDGTAASIEGATSSSYTPSTSATGTTYYFCKVTSAVGDVYYTDSAQIVVSKSSAASVTGKFTTKNGVIYKAKSETTAKAVVASHRNATKIVIEKTVTIGGKTLKVTSIQAKGFSKNTKAKNVYIKSTTISQIGGQAFKRLKSGTTFHLASSKYSKYKSMLQKSGVPAHSKYVKW